MRYLIVTPTEREYRNMTSALAVCGELHNSYTVIRTGVGKALSAASTARALEGGKGEFDRIAVVGYAASTIGRERGEVVAPRVARYHDSRVPGDFVPELTEPYPLLGHDDAVVWTGDAFVNAEMIAEIKTRFGVSSGLFDMEATAICQAAEIFGDIPVVVVKMVSDVPEAGDSECSYDDFVNAHTDFGCFVDYLENLK
jgi:nucleoside phosphorylase